MPRYRPVTRLEDMCLSSIVQACSLACSRLEQEGGLSGSAIEGPSTILDLAPVSSKNQVWYFPLRYGNFSKKGY